MIDSCVLRIITWCSSHCQLVFDNPRLVVLYIPGDHDALSVSLVHVTTDQLFSYLCHHTHSQPMNLQHNTEILSFVSFVNCIQQKPLTKNKLIHVITKSCYRKVNSFILVIKFFLFIMVITNYNHMTNWSLLFPAICKKHVLQCI